MAAPHRNPRELRVWAAQVGLLGTTGMDEEGKETEG